MSQLFPDVATDTLNVSIQGDNWTKNYTVPAQYAFAVIQVSIIDFQALGGSGSPDLCLQRTSHGILKVGEVYTFVVQGGTNFSLLPAGAPAIDGASPPSFVTLCYTALLHRRPT